MKTKLDVQESDRKVILLYYRRLMRACQDITTKVERKQIRKAFEFAAKAHKDARRKSGEPYILHPISVAIIVIKEVGLDATSIICALLHDVVEDTHFELVDIRREFGSKVASIIDGLTKISGVFDHKSSAQAENFRKMLLTLADDIRVVLIKLADRLHNMRTLEHMKREGQLKIASETLYLYAPLANRLGLHSLKQELEDLALLYTNPDKFEEIRTQLLSFRRNTNSYVRSFTSSIRDKIKESDLNFTIKSRFKSVYSIYSKMVRQNIPFDEVYDLFAIRIILDSKPETEKADCWTIYSLITEEFKPNPERIRDWITIPKSNGYEALHVTVMGPKGKWIEIQIRTERMDHVAERGMAAHWRYKSNEGGQDEQWNRWLERIRDLLENPSMNAVDIVQEFKRNLVTDEVYAFTPKGDLIQLPKGSYILDLAYEIHTGIGDSCIGAKVNNKVVPLSYKLQNGDQVEILTSKKQLPKEDWLKFTRTTRAKHKIKDAIKKQKRQVAEKGEEIFRWRIRKLGIQGAGQYGQILKELIVFFHLPNKTEFFFLLGKHKLDLKKLQEFIELKQKGEQVEVEENISGRKRLESKKDFEEWLQKNRGVSSDSLIIGEDMQISDYTFGACCQPIPGDNILAFFHPDDGMVIHRTNCPNAIKLMSNWGKNIIKARFTDMHDITFLAGIRIVGEDRQGMMNSLIRVISNQLKLNIRSITIDSMDGLFEGIFKIFVQNTRELQALSAQLKEVPGVLKVTRVEDL